MYKGIEWQASKSKSEMQNMMYRRPRIFNKAEYKSSANIFIRFRKRGCSSSDNDALSSENMRS